MYTQNIGMAIPLWKYNLQAVAISQEEWTVARKANSYGENI